MKKCNLLLAILLVSSYCFAQVRIDTTSNTAHPSAMLEINSHTRGLLLPRMSGAERIGIANPATGLLVIDTTANLLYQYNGKVWAPYFNSTMQDLGSIAGTVNLDYQKGRLVKIQLTGNLILNFVNPIAGMNGVIEIKQDAAGNRQIIFPAGSTASGGLASIQLSTAPMATDILSYEFNGTSYRWFIKNDVY
jgi:hypothetical protein